MPIYEYQCSSCGEVFEAFQKVHDNPIDGVQVLPRTGRETDQPLEFPAQRQRLVPDGLRTQVPTLQQRERIQARGKERQGKRDQSRRRRRTTEGRQDRLRGCEPGPVLSGAAQAGHPRRR